MMSQRNKTVKFHSEFKWKALFANIHEEDTFKLFAKYAGIFKYSLQQW